MARRLRLTDIKGLVEIAHAQFLLIQKQKQQPETRIVGEAFEENGGLHSSRGNTYGNTDICMGEFRVQPVAQRPYPDALNEDPNDQT